MSILEAFKFKTENTSDSILQNIFPFSTDFSFFVNNDLVAVFSKILTDCIERTQGMSEDVLNSLWDNCLANEANKGLITLIAEAMVYKKELVLTYQQKVLRQATKEEAQQIIDDYKKVGASALGVYLSFANYTKTDMLKIYSGMEYCVLNSLNKSMNLSKAIQMKMSKMRESVSSGDAAAIVAQAKKIANGLKAGNDVILDAEDEIFTSKPDMASVKEAIDFIDAKKSFYLGLPISYITGEQTGGLNATGEIDQKAIERGLKHYYVSILKPTIKAIFGADTTFKGQDFRLVSQGLEALKTFELIGNDFLSPEDKKLIVAKLFDIESKE